MNDIAIEVRHLTGGFMTRAGYRRVLDDVSFTAPRGKSTAIIGETGSGKSLTALSIMRLTGTDFVLEGGEILLDGQDLLGRPIAEMREVWGSNLSMVFQDARTALNPVFTIGRQLCDVLRTHRDVSKREAIAIAQQMLREVRIDQPERRMRQFPHELSGGMAQRAMIAMALIANPRTLILDEPTTGLDVTVQDEIMRLLGRLSYERALTVCLITHDLGIVAQSCDYAVVLRHGRVVEAGECEQIFTRPESDYTRELIASAQMVQQ